ncbi:MAG: hypothetical protein HMLKMBBP_03168 [Planctomycetes bacterium]|nr:hypothetical protein [Planctomycetota bacterium]
MGAGRSLAAIGGALALAVGAVVWFMLQDGDDPAAPGTGPKDPGAERGGDGKPDPAKARTRSGPLGTGTISGKVMRREGPAPAAGQTVTLVSAAGETVAECGPEGRFQFEKLPHNTPFEVRVAAKGFATVRLAGIALSRDERRDVGTLWLDRAARAEVLVRTWGDEPVRGASVQAYAMPVYDQDYDWQKAAAQFAAEPVAVASAVTDDAGRAVFAEIASGSWTFVASKAGHSREGSAPVQLRGGDVRTDIRIHLSGAHTLAGRCVDREGKPVAGVVVIAGRSSNPWDTGAAGSRVRCVADAEGRFLLEGLGTGAYGVWGSRDGGSAAVLARVRVPGVREIDLVMSGGGRLEGVVTESESGKPVEGAVVRAMSWGASTLVAEGTTDAEGKYAIDPLPTATVNMVDVSLTDHVVERDDPATMYQPIACAPGQVARKDLKVRKGGTLSGTVKGPDGPVSGAKVSVTVGSVTGGYMSAKTTTTDHEGRFEMTGLADGTAIILPVKSGLYLPGYPMEGPWQALQNGLEASWLVPVEPGKHATAEVAMARGVRVTGKVEGTDGPLEGVRVSVFSSQGAPEPALSGANGSFVLDGVAPGPFNHTCEKDGWTVVPAEAPVTVVEGENPPVTIRMRRPGRIRGKVFSATGAPLDDARVWLAADAAPGPGMNWGWRGQADDAEGSRSFPVRSDGTFEIDADAYLGKVRVQASASGHARGASDAIDIAADRDLYETSVTLPAGAMITGRCVAGQTPVPAARISVSKKAAAMGGNMVYWGGESDEWSKLVDTVAAADGTFSAGPFADGDYKVEANAPRHVEATAQAKIPGSADVTLDLEAELEIAGVLTFREGEPVGGATVTAAPEGGTQPDDDGFVQQPTATSAADGTFRLRGLRRGKYAITAQPQWNSKVNMKAAKVAGVEAGASDVRIVAEPGLVISGRVVDAQKKGVQGVWVQAQPEKPPEDGVWHGRAIYTGSDGAFTLAGLDDGKYLVMANAQGGGGGGGKRPVHLNGISAGSAGLEIVMADGLAIEGVALGEDGKPLASIQISASPVKADGADDGEQQQWGHGQTDSLGRFKVQGLAPGKYVLTGAKWDQTQKQFVFSGGDGVAAGTTGVVLRETKGNTVTGKVVDEKGQPVAGVSLHVQSGNFWRQAQTDANGAFELTGLPEGKLTVQVWSASHVNRQVEAEAGARDLVIALEKGLASSGTLLKDDGTAAANTFIALTSADKSSQSSVQTDADGKWTVSGLRDMEYTVSAYVQQAGGGLTPKECGKLRGGDTGVTLRIP